MGSGVDLSAQNGRVPDRGATKEDPLNVENQKTR